MRALLFSDIHLDAVTAGRARRNEVLRFIDAAVTHACQEKIELIIFSGDAHDPGSVLDPLYTSDLIRRFFACVRAEHAPAIVAVAGNHDVVDTSELYLESPVTTLTPIRAAAVSCLTAEDRLRVNVFDRPDTSIVAPGVAVLGLPYVSRVHLKACVAWDRHAFEKAKGFVRDGNKLVVVAHRVVPGAQISSESLEMAKGQDQQFPFEAVAALEPCLVINGHYHARQIVKRDGLSIVVPGSGLRFTFGEASEERKGFCLVEIA